MSTGKSVLILGGWEDPHVRVVSAALDLIGVSVSVLDVWESWRSCTLVLTGKNEQQLSLPGIGRIIGVWNRLKPRLGSGLLGEEEAFALRERREYLYGSIRASGINNVINDPFSQECARNKIVQLRLAASLGLMTPRTVISNDASAVCSCDLLTDEIIYKPLSWLSSTDGRMLFTNVVSRPDLLDNQESIARAPGIFQDRIAKKYEYRVVVLDCKVISVRIFSQERLDTLIDWRRNQMELRYEACRLPSEIESKLVGLTKALGLRFAAIDMIESPEGEFIFLEANPAGNWLWIEERLSLQISQAIAVALAESQ